jgi:hypothetical protein
MLNGYFQNVIGYIFSNDAVLMGALSVNSNLIM